MSDSNDSSYSRSGEDGNGNNTNANHIAGSGLGNSSRSANNQSPVPSSRPRPGNRKRRSFEMSSSSTTSGQTTNTRRREATSVSSIHHGNGGHPQHSHLTFLGLSKSWMAAANRARTHPHEAQYGCTSSARVPLPLKQNGNNNNSMASSPLAIACRYGAPPETVYAILNADKSMVRRCIPNRGTPLHEAIMTYPRSGSGAGGSAASDQNDVNDLHYVEIIRMLLEADEGLESKDDDGAQINSDNDNDSNGSSTSRGASERCKTPWQRKMRAALMQDVDGNNALHLLVRQAFYNYLGGMRDCDNHEEDSKGNGESKECQQHPLLTILEDLIKSSPEASAMPDCTEFEETPLILVLKSSIYAVEQHQIQQRSIRRDDDDDNDEDDDTKDLNYNAQLERRIFDVCKLMLQSHPFAASSVASKSGYTAVHSAVFHGRCCDTIRLLLSADSLYRAGVRKKIEDEKKIQLSLIRSSSKKMVTQSSSVPIPAAMRVNRFGECPLHFAAMRGECTRTIELLSHAAPWAVLKRDVKFGLTPLHWLVVRFVDTMYEHFGERSFNYTSVQSIVRPERNSGGVDIFHSNRATLSPDMAGNTTFAENNEEKVGVNSSVDSDNIRRKEKNNQIKFDLEYHRRTVAIDPPVDYMRMRHILPEHSKVESILTVRVIQVLSRVRERHHRLKENVKILQSQKCQRDHITDESRCPRDSKNEEAFRTVTTSSSCPFSKGAEKRGNELYTQPAHCTEKTSVTQQISDRVDDFSVSSQKQTEHESSDPKKCPFRCPFVSDSYPLDPALIGSEEEVVREEQVISLFWAKVTSLLHAAAVAQMDVKSDEISQEVTVSSARYDAIEKLRLTSECIEEERMYLLHSACSGPSPLCVVRLCLALYPEQLMRQDLNGKLPLHHAACRVWDAREFSAIKKPQDQRSQNDPTRNAVEGLRNNPDNEPARPAGEILIPNVRTMQEPTTNLIENESSRALQIILSSSPSKAALTWDSERRLPFHYAINSTVKTLLRFFDHQSSRDLTANKKENNCRFKGATDKEPFDSVMNVLQSMIHLTPEVVEKRDGSTGLYPFMGVAAAASEYIVRCDDVEKKSKVNRCTISMAYLILLENPSVIQT